MNSRPMEYPLQQGLTCPGSNELHADLESALRTSKESALLRTCSSTNKLLTNNTFQDLQFKIEIKSTQSVRVPIAKYFSSGLRDTAVASYVSTI